MVWPLIIMAASAVASASAAKKASKAQKKSDAFNAESSAESAKVAVDNAKVAGFQAEDAEARAELEAQEVGRQQADMRGTQAANLGASNLDVSFGSAKSILDQTDTFGLEDQRRALDAGIKEAWALRARGAGLSAEATALSRESAFSRGRSNAARPGMAAFTSLLGSAGNIAQSYARSS